jgi:hypothetical protein
MQLPRPAQQFTGKFFLYKLNAQIKMVKMA